MRKASTSSRADYRFDRHGAPVWYVLTRTVQAMERAGVLERVNLFQAWRDDRRLVG